MRTGWSDVAGAAALAGAVALGIGVAQQGAGAGEEPPGGAPFALVELFTSEG